MAAWDSTVLTNCTFAGLGAYVLEILNYIVSHCWDAQMSDIRVLLNSRADCRDSDFEVLLCFFHGRLVPSLAYVVSVNAHNSSECPNNSPSPPGLGKGISHLTTCCKGLYRRANSRVFVHLIHQLLFKNSFLKEERNLVDNLNTWVLEILLR